MTRSKLDEEAMRLADKAELGDPSRFELDEMADCLRRLVEENGRMRSGLEAAHRLIDGQQGCSSETGICPPGGCDFCKNWNGAEAAIALALTPTPAVETKPKCQRCGDTGLVPAFGAPGMKDICACVPRPGPEHYIESKPKCGRCGGTGCVAADREPTWMPCPDCATEGGSK